MVSPKSLFYLFKIFKCSFPTQFRVLPELSRDIFLYTEKSKLECCDVIGVQGRHIICWKHFCKHIVMSVLVHEPHRMLFLKMDLKEGELKGFHGHVKDNMCPFSFSLYQNLYAYILSLFHKCMRLICLIVSHILAFSWTSFSENSTGYDTKYEIHDLWWWFEIDGLSNYKCTL